jgi:unsaturated rhamnogalacturonyl hydrolase
MNLPIFLFISVAPAVLLGADRMAVGLTGTKKVINASVVPGASRDVPTVLLIGGLDGDENSVQIVTHELNNYAGRPFRLLAIPNANPDKVHLAFPPTGRAYKENPESHYLWRWIGTQAPDLVVIAGEEDGGLADALSQNKVAGVGRIPAKSGLLSSLPKNIEASEAHSEIRRRIARTPQQVAGELAQFYGHDEFKEVVYIGAMSLVGQLRLGHVSEVERAVAPFVNGSKDSLAKATSSHLAGHLLFAELAERTGDKRYVDLVRRAADLGFTDAGDMRESMPLHNEMSDSVFMGCPILAAAGKLARDRKYFEMALRHLKFMQKLCLRPDGLYRHSPLDAAAWGRGNAFPALGLALTLSRIPADDAAFPPILQAYRSHMNALAAYQDEDGMWRQVIDLPGSYPEFSATAMIATAMLRGIRRGWLDASRYQPLVDKAWTAIKARISADGTLVDVCESTGKRASVDDYLNRLAILDRDPRGGGMALLLATEIAGLP